jgi:uncharacterized membrane protein YccF (DUF307 family)
MGEDKTPEVWRVMLTVLIGFGWLIFLGIWLFFYSSSFTIVQDIAIFLISLAIVGLIMVVLWVPWGMKYGK